jgi:serine/threonine protein kinase
MFKLLSREKHPNLLTLLTTYELHGRFHLVFPWGESDLDNYWKEVDPRSLSDGSTVRWIARQAAGIASGLLRIHGPHTLGQTSSLAHTVSFPLETQLTDEHEILPDDQSSSAADQSRGHHGDLKPQNILVFPSSPGEDYGTLKISDFGLGGLRKRAPSSSSGTFRPTPAYTPPEHDTDGADAWRSSGDVWALGCLYLEFIVWFFGGADYLREFQIRRQANGRSSAFYEAGRYGKVDVKPSVRKVRTLCLLCMLLQRRFSLTESSSLSTNCVQISGVARTSTMS